MAVHRKFKSTLYSAFSLLELVTVVLIVGILGAIGMVSYRQHLVRARSAEMYQYISAIETAQMLYHTEYQTFLFLKNATSVDAKAAMDTGSRFLIDGGESAHMRANWNALGPVYPLGTQSYLYLVSNMGKFFADGTQATFGDSWSIGPISRPLFRDYDTFTMDITSGGQSFICVGEGSVVSYEPTDFGAIANPARAYDWVLTSTVAKLGSTDADCYQIARLMTWDSRFNVYKKKGFINFIN